MLDLKTVLAPVVNLTGSRRDYSDVLAKSNQRSRTLARETLLATLQSLPLRLGDGDGPDGIPYSAWKKIRGLSTNILHAVAQDLGRSYVVLPLAVSFLSVSGYGQWHGGVSFGPRHLTTFVVIGFFA